ncbi:glutamine amidotransferase [Acidobacteria bacterium AB60]|nr:glutamine amidotransferase [Acidobacteria bacterium AB60]
MRNCSVHLFVFDGMADWEPAFATAAIQNPQFQLNPGCFRVTTAARFHAPIRTMGGVRILPDMTIDEVNPSDSSLLILPGGDSWEHGGNLEGLERAHAFIDEGVPVAAIGTSTLALARTGLLDNRLHTGDDADCLRASGYRGARHYRDVPAIADRGLVTAASAAPVEFAREISRLLELQTTASLNTWYSLYRHCYAPDFSAGLARTA